MVNNNLSAGFRFSSSQHCFCFHFNNVANVNGRNIKYVKFPDGLPKSETDKKKYEFVFAKNGVIKIKKRPHGSSTSSDALGRQDSLAD